MPPPRDIFISDSITVYFDEPNDAKYFKLTVVNQSIRVARMKKIGIYLDSLTLVNLNDENAEIQCGDRKNYIFKAQFKNDVDCDETKIRFTFSDRKHLTRTVRIVYSPSPTENEKPTATDERPNRNDVEKLIENAAEVGKLTECLENLEMPDNASKEDWANDLRCKTQPITVSDQIQILFEESKEPKSCEVSVTNNSFKPIQLHFVGIDLSSVRVLTSMPLELRPRSESFVRIEADHVEGGLMSLARVRFNFEAIGLVTRSIRLVYRTRGPNIQVQQYNAPDDVIDAVFLEDQMSAEKLEETMNALIPSVEDDYVKHFHNLLYFEEVGLRREFKEKYSQNKAFFGDTNYYMEDGVQYKTKYEPCVYDLTVNELFETRPSLQLGDKVIARKHSEPSVAHEGLIIETKEVDLIVIKFGDNFVISFDHSAYFVDFTFSRSNFVRQHFAIDMAADLFGKEYLIPTQIQLRRESLLNVRLNQNMQLVMKKGGQVLQWFNDNLNQYQKEAVQKTLKADLIHPYMIFGPPGTGKTTTLQEIILQILYNIPSSRIVIATQSNSAANLITERLLRSNHIEKRDMLRLISYIYSKKNHTLPEGIQDVCLTVQDLQGNEDDLAKAKTKNVLEQIRNYRIVIGTSTTISQLLEVPSLLKYFSHAIVDEAGQCTEIDVLIPMLLVGKMGQTIMAGDPMQMPPLVINKQASDRGLNIPVINRMQECYNNIEMTNYAKDYRRDLMCKLLCNYRSLPSILDYYNTQFYDSELISMMTSNSSELDYLLQLNEYVPEFNPKSEYGIHFFNIEGRNEKHKNSWFNVSEVRAVRVLVERLTLLGLAEEDIGVITPYAIQTRALEKALHLKPKIKVGTVEEFQGLERKVIVISTVRTCSNRAIIDVTRRLGFVRCKKRINVAVSRAQVMVIVVGRAELLAGDEKWNALIEGCKANHTYMDADLYMTSGIFDLYPRNPREQ